jgi:hypothetical protein
MKTTLPLLLASLPFALLACGGESHDHAHPHPHPEAAKPADKTAGAPSHDHAHDPAQRKELGNVTISARTIAVIRVAAIEPGKESDFDLDFGAHARPAVVRCWVGLESAKSSRKVLFANEGDTVMHGHPEVPSPLPQGSRFWIAIEENGATATGSVAIDG